ncbi:MAG: ATP-binding cassette domain-containing protein, partial [Burkholderiaceae bacterium]|nr:ATP-binding cassette domain-containing protein [Burkholderiaceae bacterium]
MAQTAPPPPPPALAARAEPVVRIEGLQTTFGKGDEAYTVHQGLSLDVERGEILALVGGSGTGKTVLLRQMLGLLQPAAGSVTVLGRPAAEMGGQGAASRVGMLFQHGALFSAFNVLDNVAFALREQGTLPADLVRDAALVKLQMVGLEPAHATRMPADLSG